MLEGTCVVAVCCCRVLLQSVVAVCCRCATNFRGSEALSRTYSRVKMCCTMLQVCCRCVAGVLQRVVACCIVAHYHEHIRGYLCVAACGSVLQCVTANCNYTSSIQKYQWTQSIIKLQCVAVCCKVFQCVAACCSAHQ